MAQAGWQMARTSFYTATKRASKTKRREIIELAHNQSFPLVEQRVGRRVARQHAQSYGVLDVTKLTKGYDNSQTAWRWNGVSRAPKTLQLGEPMPATYTSTLSNQMQFAAVAAEFAYHSNKGKTPPPSTVQLWNPQVLFPSSTVLVDMRSPRPSSFGKPITVFDPYADNALHALDDIFGVVLRQEMTDQLICIYQQAPHDVIEEMIGERIAAEIRVVIAQGRGILSMGALLDSPSYAFSALVGNACLSEDIGIKTPSARNYLAPNQDFLRGSVNVILPVEDDGSTGMELNGVWDFDPIERRFEYTPKFLLEAQQYGGSM